MAESRSNDILHIVEHRNSPTIAVVKEWLQASDLVCYEVGANADCQRSEKIGHAESVIGVERPPQEFWVEMVEVLQLRAVNRLEQPLRYECRQRTIRRKDDIIAAGAGGQSRFQL